MTKCPKRFKKFLGIFTMRDNHFYLITNVFSTLESQEYFDVVKTCQSCGNKQVFLVDKDVLKEIVALYPNAFNEVVRSYILSWTR